MRIKSITTEYDQEEDRIRLAVADEQGLARQLWLTRRLAERLVPALLEGLVAVPADSRAVSGQSERASPSAQAARQVYAQLEARLSQKPAAPVRVAHLAEGDVVREVNLVLLPHDGRKLTFRFKVGDPAELFLTGTEFRQWLEVLRRAFGRGQWRDDIWPDWVRGLGRPGSA